MLNAFSKKPPTLVGGDLDKRIIYKRDEQSINIRDPLTNA